MTWLSKTVIYILIIVAGFLKYDPGAVLEQIRGTEKFDDETP